MEFNPKFNKTELCAFLIQKGVEEDDAKKIQEEKVDGETFQDISENDLKEIGVRLGTRKKILKLIQNLKMVQNNQKYLGNGELQDIQIVQGDSSYMSNSLVFDLITSGSSCTVLPTISSTESLAVPSARSLSVPSTGSLSIPSTGSLSAPSTQTLSPLTKRMTVPVKRILSRSKRSPLSSVCSTISSLGEGSSECPTNGYFDPQTIDVKAMLESHSSGKKILENLKTGSITRSDISEIVRICVRSMVDDLKTVYPSTVQKQCLAIAIVRDIPELKSKREGVEGYEQFFDPRNNSGSIEWRLKTLRVSLPPDSKKNRKVKPPIGSKENQHTEVDEEDSACDEVTMEKVEPVPYPCPLPSFSPAIRKAIANGTILGIYNRFVRECCAHLLSLTETPGKEDYDSFALSLSEVYPFVNDPRVKGLVKYKRFKKMLSQSIRNARHYSKRVKSESSDTSNVVKQSEIEKVGRPRRSAAAFYCMIR